MAKNLEPIKGPGGRPTKYDPAKMVPVIMKLARVGASRVEIAAELGVVKQTLYNWEDEHPDFVEVMKEARDVSQAWWEKQGRKGIWSRDFNAPAYSLQIRNRFPDDWRDRKDHELSGPGGQPLFKSYVGVDTDEV